LILKSAARRANRVQESVRGDGSVTRIGNGRTNEPDCTSVRAVYGLLSFSSAVIRLQLVVELMSGQDNGSSIQIKAVLGADGREYIFTGLNRGVGRLCEPEIRDDPHAQQIVAEIAEGRVIEGRLLAILVFRVDAVAVAAIHRVAIGGEPPVLPEIGGEHSVDAAEIE